MRQCIAGGDQMTKGIPKKDGTGGGNRENKGRSGCKTTEKTGKGKNG